MEELRFKQVYLMQKPIFLIDYAELLGRDDLVTNMLALREESIFKLVKALEFLICSLCILPFIINHSPVPWFFPQEKIQKFGMAEIAKQAGTNGQHKFGGISVEFVHNFHVL